MPSAPDCSIVIPVFNSAPLIEPLVEEIRGAFAERNYEIVLVNDGSRDHSERKCVELARRYPQVRFVQLTRNFGEHSAVLAGLHCARGAAVVIMDDDGQHPPVEAVRLLDALQSSGCDVVYGRYRIKYHGQLRNVGSWANDRVATWLLDKPAGLYLSSFKAMSRFTVDELKRYQGSFPYIDGLILRATDRIEQLDVQHRPRRSGVSGYNLSKLVGLWFNMFFNFSMLPLRFSALLGFVCALGSVLLLPLVIIDKLWLNPGVTGGVPTILLVITFIAGVQFMILGTIGEYLGRLFLDQSGAPQFVVRYATPVVEPQEHREDG